MTKDHLELLGCPDCRGGLEPLPSLADDAVLHCARCELLFPVDDGIPILLPSNARNPKLEAPLLARVRGVADERAPAAREKTEALLASHEGRTTWEWEDEAFWGDEYRRHSAEAGQPRTSMRTWQREFLSKGLLGRADLHGKVLLDVGCGGGNNFRTLFCEHCDGSTIYVAADISIDGLKLNRQRNPHENALYVVCSANSLPFRPESIDVICYFGVLHHTERKSRTIPEDYGLLRPGGFMVVHEALERASAAPGFLSREALESPHEERVDPVELEESIASVEGLETIARFEMHTVFFGALRKPLRRLAGQRRRVYEAMIAVDRALMRAFRGVSSFFRPGEIMLLLRRRES